MTSLINVGVPVALIASRNFSRMLTHLERRCPLWESEQFVGRIKLRRMLPDKLEADDLFNIAAVLLPDADEATRTLLVGHAMRSQGYVAALESGATRARFFAEQARRGVACEDVERVMNEAGTETPAAAPAPPVPSAPPQKRRGRSAKVSRASSGMRPELNRQPLGALTGVIDFTGSRPPGLLP